MRELICEYCASRQPFDPRPGARCLDCGGPVKAPTRCYGCRETVPPNPKCAVCGLPTIAPEDFAAAVMLAAEGLAPAKIRDAVSGLGPDRRKKLEAEYRKSWLAVDDALETISRLMAVRTLPMVLEMTRNHHRELRQTMTPAQLLPILRDAIKTWKGTPPVLPPWPVGIAKAIHEAAPRKLDYLDGRPRGLDDDERRRILEHAKLVGDSYGKGSGPFVIGMQYLSALAHTNALIPGEATDQNEPRPILELHEASRNIEPVEMAIPVSLFRKRGIVWAVGPRPTHEVRAPWVPDGYLWAPFKGKVLPLHDVDGLREFLKTTELPIEPLTLSHVVHWLLAPFPWDARPEVDEDLVHAWHGIEIEHMNFAYEKRKKPRSDSRDELTVKIGSATLVYRTPKLTIRGTVPGSKRRIAVPKGIAKAQAPPERSDVEETVCMSCGVRRPHDPRRACPNCGAPADAGTECFGCLAEVPPGPRCPDCGLPALPRARLKLATMLRAKGVETSEIPERVGRTTPAEERELQAWYAAAWGPVDAMLDRCARAFALHTAPSTAAATLKTLRLQRWHQSAAETLATVEPMTSAMEKNLPSIAPFPIEICKAIHEAAPRRLAQWREVRGLEDDDRGDVHAGARGFGGESEEDAAWGLSAAFLYNLKRDHLFVAGETHDRNDSKPLFELHEAAKGGIPVTLIRGRGVVYAEGPKPTPDVDEPWIPTGFVFGKLRLHEKEDLRRFLRELALPIEPATLPFLLDWLLAPFPWSTGATEPTRLVERWKNLEWEENPKSVRANELVLQVAGTTVIYRSGGELLHKNHR